MSANIQKSLLVTHKVMSAENSYLNQFSEERRDKLDILFLSSRVLDSASVQAGVLHAEKDGVEASESFMVLGLKVNCVFFVPIKFLKLKTLWQM